MSLAIRWRVLERDEFTCRYCGRKAPDVALEVDHVVPRSLGGGDSENNLVTACFECNRGKRDRVLQGTFKDLWRQVREAELHPLNWLVSERRKRLTPKDRAYYEAVYTGPGIQP